MKKGPLHILHCIYSMGVGGAETMLVDIVNAQVGNGDRVTLLVVNDEVNQALMSKLDPRVEIVLMRRRQGSRPLLMMLRLNLIISRLHPDVIHVHHHKFCRLVVSHSNRLVLTVHDMGTAMHYASGKRMIAITDSVRDDVLKRVPAARVSTVLNGIRMGAIKRRNRGQHPGVFRIVQVARLMYEKKGQDILIKALGILSRKGVKNIEVTFIGGGPELSYLQQLARDEGVADRVRFEGLKDRDYIYSHLADYDAMCHPSRYEGFGLTVAEGMAAGLPLLVTEGDGPWEVADHGRLCYSFANGNAEACAEALERLTSDYPAALRMAEEALQYVVRYDICRTVAEYDSYYRNKIL